MAQNIVLSKIFINFADAIRTIADILREVFHFSIAMNTRYEDKLK